MQKLKRGSQNKRFPILNTRLRLSLWFATSPSSSFNIDSSSTNLDPGAVMSDSGSDDSESVIECDVCRTALDSLLTKEIHELTVHGIFQDHLYSLASFDPFWDYNPPADVADDDSEDYIDFSEESYPVDVVDDDSEFVGESSHRRPAIRKPDNRTAINRLMKLVLDREDDAKLMRRVAEAEAEDARRRVEEAEVEAAAEVARKKLEEDQDMERQIAIKDTNLPPEPASDDESALNIKVYMPDGSLRRRRFLRTHLLQALFDFIDTCRIVKPGSYVVARLFPWRGYNDHDLALTLNEVVTDQEETFYVKASKW